MGQFSVEILGGDEERDFADFLLEACGIEYFDFLNNKRLLTREIFEQNWKYIEYIFKPRISRWKVYLVLGYFYLVSGSPPPEDMFEEIILSIDTNTTNCYEIIKDNSDQLDERLPLMAKERIIYLNDLKQKLITQTPGVPRTSVQLTYYYGNNSYSGEYDEKIILSPRGLKQATEEKRLKKIRHINLGGWGLKNIPPIIFEIHNLESLELTFNQLKDIPEEIEKLNHLKDLYLDDNCLKTFPESIKNLDTLEYLILSNNYISSIPSEIKKMKSLQKVYLEGNPIGKIPLYKSRPQFFTEYR